MSAHGDAIALSVMLDGALELRCACGMVELLEVPWRRARLEVFCDEHGQRPLIGLVRPAGPLRLPLVPLLGEVDG